MKTHGRNVQAYLLGKHLDAHRRRRFKQGIKDDVASDMFTGISSPGRDDFFYIALSVRFHHLPVKLIGVPAA
ncbi:hypothetical protein [Mycobacteroides chelonae]|uniref:hypothetical protein n=1 Tax=Mycobacteroides chelonae TaxID=1774 RepID=UPI001F402598|nr:hypothetical protein [Mycobacteroides chelonae]